MSPTHELLEFPLHNLELALEPRMAIVRSENSTDADRETAFTEVVREYYDVVYSNLAGMTRSIEIAAEATQSTFLTAWEKPDSCTAEGPGMLYNWLMRIARNKALDIIKKNKRWSLITLEHPIDNLTDEYNSALIDPFSPDPSRIYEARETLGVISGLSKDHRQVLWMYGAGYCYGDLAEELGVPIGTISSRMSRATKAATILLGAYESNSSIAA